MTEATNSNNALGVWGDGTYIYVGDWTGIDAYKFDGTTLTYIASETTHSTSAGDICGDGTYLYVVDLNGGMQAYSFNGTAFTYLATVSISNGYGVWCSGGYIYVATGAVGGLSAYTFNGVAFTFVSSASATSASDVWSDGTYIYLADSGGGIKVFAFNGTSFTLKASDNTHSINAAGIWGDGGYVYVADGAGGVDAYSFNGTSLTFLATITANTTNARRVWAKGGYIYVADLTGGLDVYTFNGTAFSFKTSESIHSTQAQAIWGDGKSVYVGDSANLDIYRVYNTCGAPYSTHGTLQYNSDWRVMQYCDGTKWQSMGPPKRTFSPAITFDGTNDYLLRGADLTTNADSTKVTGSVWFRNRVAGGGGMIYCTVDTATSCRFSFQTTSTFTITGKGTGGGSLILQGAGGTTIGDTNWHHIMFSIDLTDTAKRFVYLDGVLNSLTWSTYTNAVIDFTRTEHSVGAFTNGTSKFDGDLDDLWIDMGTYLDLSRAEIRAKFRDAAGNPVDLGATGTNPTGTQPEVYLSSRGAGLSGWATNKGSGGGFTVTGALASNTVNLPNMSCSHSIGINFLGTDITQSTNALNVWGDGSYIYVTNNSGGGLVAYSFNGTTLTYINKILSPTPYNVRGDGTYIYGATGFNGIRAYTFNGATFNLVASDTGHTTNAQYVWVGGGYIYVADWTGGLDVYSFNGSTFTWLASDTINSTNAQGVWGDGTYIYVADNSNGIEAYTFNGTTLTYKAKISTNLTNASKIWGDGNYIYVADIGGGIAAYTFNGTAFTFKAKSTFSSISSDVSGDGTYIYAANVSAGVDAYTFNGTTFIYKANDKIHSTNATGLWSDGVHLFVADAAGGIDYYSEDLVVDMCSCSSPLGKEGAVVYNSAASVLQFCNGQSWQRIGK